MAEGLHCYLDRFEGDLAILVINDEEKMIAASLLPSYAREGDHISLTITCNVDARSQTAEEIARLQQDLETGRGAN